MERTDVEKIAFLAKENPARTSPAMFIYFTICQVDVT